MGWMSNLRSWAARRIAPPAVPNEPAASREATAAVRAETAGGLAQPVAVGTDPRPPVGLSSSTSPFPQREPSPAERKRKQQQEDVLAGQLSNGLAGWVSDHGEEAGQCAGWVYVATDARAKRVAAAELTVYRRDPADRKARTPVRPDHPLWNLLDRPNPRYDLAGLLYRIEMQLCLTGTALVWVRKNGLGLPGELWVLPTALARPQPPSPEYPEGAYQVSVISLGHWAMFGGSFWNTPSGVPLTIDARDVVRVSYPHPLTEADGLSPVNANGQAIDVARSAEEAIWSIFERGPLPPQVISIDKDLRLEEGDADEIRDGIEEKLGGARNAGKVQVVQGAKVEKMAYSPTETIPEDLRNQNRDMVMAMHGVPAIVAGVADAAAYSALYAALQQFDSQQIGPELDFIDGALTRTLACRFGPDLAIDLEPKPLNDPELELRKRQQATTEAEAMGSLGVATVDEVRRKLGLGPHPDPAKGRETAGKPPAPVAVPGLPGQPPPGPDGLPGGPEDTDLEPGEADEDGTGQPDPARRAAPVEALNRLRGKAFALPPGLWNGHQRGVRS